MLQSVHAEIMRRALRETFGTTALQVIISANLGVDALWNQLGHDELHFDNNAFARSWAYIAAQRGLIRPALERGRLEDAWSAFGRLTHTAQDFYAHTNYVSLWVAAHTNGRGSRPEAIDAGDEELLRSPSLHSGKAYLPLGVLSFIPGFGRLVQPLFPADSHARMNLDSASRGPLFEFAFEAAVKRTRDEYNIVARELSVPLLAIFRADPRPSAS